MDLHDTIDDDKFDDFNQILDQTDDFPKLDIINQTMDVGNTGGLRASFQDSDQEPRSTTPQKAELNNP